jgi:hypothetical protein
MSLKNNLFNGQIPKVFNPKNFIVTNLLDDIISNTITSQQVQAPVIQRVSAETGETDDFITQSELDVELNDLKSLLLGSDALSNSLNSIAEINSAINSDPQFYTHITSSISTKANQSDLNATNGNVSALDTRLDSAETTIGSHTTTLSTHATQIASKLSATNPTFSGTLTGSSIVDNGTFSASGNCVLGTSTANNVTLNSNIVANGATISPTELSRLDGITANIQSSLDSKLNASNPTFSGTLTGASIVDNGAFSASGNVTLGTSTANNVTLNSNIVANGLTISPIELSRLDGITANIQSSLDSKLNASNPTFSGTLTGASIVDNGTFSASGNCVLGTTSANTVTLNSSIVANGLTISPTELSMLDNASSNLQTQINNKLNASNPTFTGTLTGSSIVDNGTFSASGNCVLGTDASNTITLNSSIVANALTISPTELSRLDGITGNIQSSLDGKCNNTLTESWNGVKTFVSSPIVPDVSALDNSGKVANTKYVDSAINTLIGGAPSALNSLNELALALSNDSSYSTTITTALSGKASLTNNTFNGNQIYNTGTVTFNNGLSSNTITLNGEDLDSRLDTDEANIASNTTSIGTLNTTVSGHTTSIGTLNTTVSGHTTSINSLNAKTNVISYDGASDTLSINAKLDIIKDIGGDANIYLGDAVGNDLIYLRGTIVANSCNITPTELSQIDGITQNIETALNAKALNSATCHNTGTETWAGQKSFSTGITLNGTDLNTRLTNDESTISSHTSSISSINSSITTLNGKCSALTYDSGTDTTTISSKMSIAKDVSDVGSIYLGDNVGNDIIYLRGNISANGQTVTGQQIGYLSTLSSAVQGQINGKQATLTFDSTPTSSSTNPVTSGGVYTALGTKQATLTFDSTPTSSSSNPVTSGGVYTALGTKQATLTWDSSPTSSSSNAISSGNIYTALALKSNLASPSLTGTPLCPTASTGDNSTQIASTAFVKAQSYLTTSSASSTYAPLASATLTGTPLCPTASTGDNSTQIASTAFVKAQSYLTTSSASSTYAGLSSNNSFSGTNNVNLINENINYVSGVTTSLSLDYTTCKGINLIATPTSNYSLAITNVPTGSTNAIYTVTLITTAKYYVNSITVNGTSRTLVAGAGLANVSINASATHVMQQLNICFLNSSTPVVTTNVISLW